MLDNSLFDKGGQLQASPQPDTMNAMGGGGSDWHSQYHNSLMDWRGQRPAFDPSATDWHQQMMDWRGLRPDRHDYRMGQVPQQAQQAPAAAMPNTQFPLNPMAGHPGMVGQSYGVQGMHAAANPYGLPTY